MEPDPCFFLFVAGFHADFQFLSASPCPSALDRVPRSTYYVILLGLKFSPIQLPYTTSNPQNAKRAAFYLKTAKLAGHAAAPASPMAAAVQRGRHRQGRPPPHLCPRRQGRLPRPRRRALLLPEHRHRLCQCDDGGWQFPPQWRSRARQLDHSDARVGADVGRAAPLLLLGLQDFSEHPHRVVQRDMRGCALQAGRLRPHPASRRPKEPAAVRRGGAPVRLFARDAEDVQVACHGRPKAVPSFDHQSDWIAGPKVRLDVSLTLLVAETSLRVAPHGVIGQSFDASGVGVDGARDPPPLPGLELTTAARQRGASRGHGKTTGSRLPTRATSSSRGSAWPSRAPATWPR